MGRPAGTTRALREVTVAPGPEGARLLAAALGEALAGGPAVAPVPAGDDEYTRRVRAALRPDDPTAPLERSDVVAVVSTSGSTGDPRGVLLTGTAVRTATAALEQRLGGPGDWVLALAGHSVGGLMVVVRTLLARTGLHVDPSTGGAASFEADAFAATVAAARAGGAPRLYASLVPTQLQRLVAAGPVGLDSLRALDAVLSGAAATPTGLLETLRGNRIRVLASYGMSETCGGCAYDGVPQPGLVFRTDAADGSSPGRLSVSGRAVAAGYRLRPDHPDLRDGTVLTGDLGVIDAEGRVTVLGRADDVVVVGGTNVALPAVEATLRGVPGVADVCVVAVPDPAWGARVVAFVSPAAGGVADEQLAAAVREQLGRAAVPRAFPRLEGIPLLPSGKPDRLTLARRATAH